MSDTVVVATRQGSAVEYEAIDYGWLDDPKRFYVQEVTGSRNEFPVGAIRQVRIEQ